MIIRVIDGIPHGLPEEAGATLKSVVADAAQQPVGSGDLSVGYSGPQEASDSGPAARQCVFDPTDLVIGGREQEALLLRCLESAERRMIVHSTFLSAERFEALAEPIRAACHRGVTFDLLFGAERDEDTEKRSTTAAMNIARIVREDPDMNGRFRVHMRSTGSHAKMMLFDTAENWIAVIGSCNWFWSPFHSVECSVVLRDPAIVADVALAIQRLVGRRGLADSIATEMALTARDLRRIPPGNGPDSLSIIVGEAHDRLIRMASGSAEGRFFIGCHRLGSTARPGALMPGEVAARRSGATVTVLYTQPSGPLKNRHARVLKEEAARNGVHLIKAKKTVLHGKMVAWDSADVAVTSLNWASASANPDFPWADIGVHIHSLEIADVAMSQFERLFPELKDENTAD